MKRGRSLINNKNKVGPRIETCGTPDSIYVNAERPFPWIEIDLFLMDQIFVLKWKHFSTFQLTRKRSRVYAFISLERDNLLLILLSSGQCHLTLLLKRYLANL